MRKAFVICTVRDATPEYRAKLEAFVAEKEATGIKCHLPHRDTNQDASGINICTQNMRAIRAADVIYVFYNAKSTGTHFDLGIAFALGKQIEVIENGEIFPGKCFPRMMLEWQERDAESNKGLFQCNKPECSGFGKCHHSLRHKREDCCCLECRDYPGQECLPL
jgi:nucleoside 2-deoxyribosyltransferase